MVTKLCCDVCGLGIAPGPGGGAPATHEVEVGELRPPGCHPADGRFKVTVVSAGAVDAGAKDGELDLCLHCRIRVLELGVPTRHWRAVYEREQRAMDEDLGGRVVAPPFGQGDPLGENERAAATANEILSRLRGGGHPAAAAPAGPPVDAG
jgi:hypothetical protein